MSETTIFECPYNLFLKQRLEFVVICDDHLAANVMRIFEREMIKLKETWQVRVEKALESKKTPPPEPKSYWVRLSQAQIIARLYMYDSAKIKKPDSDDPASDEWAEYHRKKALSISKGTLRKAIDLLIGKGFLIERSKPGEEFGAPIYTLHKVNVQKALKALPSNPFTIFHYLGGVENFEPGGDIQNLNLPPTNFEPGEMQNLEVPPTEIGSGDIQNLNVNIDSSIDLLEDIEIDNEIEGTGNVAHRELPTPAPDTSQDEPYHPDFSASQEKSQGDDINGQHDSYHSASGDNHRDVASIVAIDTQRVAQTQQQAPAVAELSTSIPQSGKVAHAVKQPRKPSSQAKKPPVPEFSSEGRKVYDAWCSLFKSPPRVGPKTVECADALYPLLVPWCKELHVSCAALLDEIKGQMYTADTKGFYKRGITLCDVERDFEKWQSAKTQEMSPKRSAPKHIPTREEDPYSIAALLEEQNPGYFARKEEMGLWTN